MTMAAGPDVSRILAVIAEPSRAAMLASLLGATMLPAGELARCAGVTAQTASGHLLRLLEAGIVAVEVQGRHRYYRLASEQAATAVEALLALAPPPRVRSLRESELLHRLRKARTCYDHLAGELGVALEEALRGSGAIIRRDRDYTLTAAGEGMLAAINIDGETLRCSRRVLARACLDWSERRHHVAGALGAALLSSMIELGWLRRVPGGRALQVTPTGRDGLLTVFGVRVE